MFFAGLIIVTEYSIKNKKKTSVTRKPEYCVLCGKLTEYFFDTPVESRKHYIIGVGQLCENCSTCLQLQNQISNAKMTELIDTVRKENNE